MLKPWFLLGGGGNTFKNENSRLYLRSTESEPRVETTLPLSFFFPSPWYPSTEGLKTLASVGSEFGTILFVPWFNRQSKMKLSDNQNLI